jgi:hypothetical protein
MGPNGGVLESRLGKRFFFSKNVQTGAGVHPPYLMGTGMLSRGGKRLWRDVQNSPPSRASKPLSCLQRVGRDGFKLVNLKG